MSWFLLALVFLSVCTFSQARHNIVSSRNVKCPEEPCITLSQFATNYDSYHWNDTDLEVSLLFLPGNHTLDCELSLAHIENLSMITTRNNVFVRCSGPFARFTISNATFLFIKGLHFIGCGGNTVNQVERVMIENTIFEGVQDKGTALVLIGISNITIIRSSFLFNLYQNISEHLIQTAIKNDLPVDFSDQYYLEPDVLFTTGGALFVANSSITIDSCRFWNNTAELGGAVFAYNCNINLFRSTFSTNRADYGAVMATSQSFLYITNCSFSENTAEYCGGVMLSYDDTYVVTSTNYRKNSAGLTGGVVDAIYSTVNVTDSTFTDNLVEVDGGVIYAVGSYFIMTFIRCTNNIAYDHGGVVFTEASVFSIVSSTFARNSAAFGGVLDLYMSSLDAANSTFNENRAHVDSGVMWCVDGSISVSNSRFSSNTVVEFGGVMLTSNCSIHAANSSFDNNMGSLYTFNSRLTFSGHVDFKNCEESTSKSASKDIATYQEGGAITSFKSTIIFTGTCSLTRNRARRGGAILATDSTIIMDGNISIANNVALSGNGGGISLYQSILKIKRHCYISHNSATRGGGIHAHSSYITVYQPAVLRLNDNSAKYGGAMCLEVNPRLYLLKHFQYPSDDKLVFFTNNSASYGGAIFVADKTNLDACLSNRDCFIQVLTDAPDIDLESHVNIVFNENTASDGGSSLFGGLLDRCIPSAFAEISRTLREGYNGITYLTNVSNLALNSTASLPIRVCFCTSDGQPDCSYQPLPIRVTKGMTFKVSLVAIDQVGNPLNADIISSLTLSEGGLGEGQHSQSIGNNCTDLTFNVFSPHYSETIMLFADGPCRNSAPSLRHLDVQFLNCTCPIGFEPSSNRPTVCECVCDSKLSPYIANCNRTTKLLLLKESTNAWISYTNYTDPPGYVIHPNCPTDHCLPPTLNITINLHVANGADTQCAHNRTGVLCGSCWKHLSLSLGSSRCLPCYSHWPVNLVTIVLASAITGIMLVILLLVLNLTVAVGLINSFIFYANLVGVSSSIFFPSSEASFPTVVTAWLNLDIGIDVCFFDGLDAYSKVWLQLLFPAYIISLVVAIIVVSECSPRFAELIGKRDPVATLATLILLSYAKLLSTSIGSLSFAILDYPDGTRETVWLLDGNVKYFQGKHIALVIAALFIISVGLPYTFLLFFWQWYVCVPNGKMKRIRNTVTKLNAFVAIHHMPYSSKYRFWTGLLLLLRVILYVISAVTSSADPQTPLLATIIVTGSLLLIKSVSREQLCKNNIVDIVETLLLFNLLILAAFSLYHFKSNSTEQAIVGYMSTITAMILLIGVVIYHVALLIKRKEHSQQQPPPNQPTKIEITHSVIEMPKAHDHCDSQTSELDNIRDRLSN